MRKLVLIGLVSTLAICAVAPAQARWGTNSVETWVRYAGRGVGEGTTGGTMSIRMSRGQTIEVAWFIRNRGGQPSWRRAKFEGCRWGRGFHIRYFTRGGRDVTYKVTHEGFLSKVLQQGEETSLIMRITAVAVSSRACTLSAPASTRSDVVHLDLRSS